MSVYKVQFSQSCTSFLKFVFENKFLLFFSALHSYIAHQLAEDDYPDVADHTIRTETEVFVVRCDH